jgi:hypothetical protein
MGLFDKEKNKNYVKIHLEFDGSKSVKKPCVVEGDEETIAAVIGSLIKNLLENGFDEDILRDAIRFGLKDRSYFNKNISVKQIKVDKNKAKDIEELLNKLMED